MGEQGHVPQRLFRQHGLIGARRLVEEYSFGLEGIPGVIRVRIYAGLEGDWFEAEQSHYLHAPGLDGPSVPETQRYQSVEAALQEVLESFTEGYGQAIRAGHTPSNRWLMPDHEFY
ncbi:hypothetical protein [Aquisalimonas sp.]|uniref:hypothetical protein n=1 Tax=Aquisalimonas sp. TaxID=1872621 RepID=UPI0025BEE3F2|nr:hypothetical protein [Aquisalimonas sp.]